MSPALSDLATVLLDDPAPQQAWEGAAPLRAVLPHVAAAEIVACHPSTLDLPEDGGPRRIVLHLRIGGADGWYVMPADIGCTRLALSDGPLTGPRVLIDIETDLGPIRTNPQELNGVIGAGANARMTDAERRAAWMGLSGTFEQPRPRPPVPAFHLRHLGEVHPDPHGFAEAGPLDVPAFRDRPLPVEIDEAYPAHAARFDAALDAFLPAAPRLKEEATGPVHQNMLDYLRAVYRAPGEAPPPAEVIDPVFEELLALATPADVWTHVRPKSLRLVHDQKRGKAYVTLSCDCDWEEEHGLALVWRDGATLSFVGEDSLVLEER